jgi:uncharacterized Rmd1/YagE family protein
MNCQAFCTAGSYQIKNLSERLKSHYTVTLHKDALHVEVPHHGSFGDVFLFAYGACVFWNVPKEGVDMLLSAIREFEVDPIDEPETDEFTFTIGDTAKVYEDEIFLPNRDPLTKLAISYGIAQSVKLSVFESAILKTFNSTRSIPLNLAKEGKIHLSRKEIRKKMGELFLERAVINLHLDALDTPEFFWEDSELEPLYKMITVYLDVQPRVEVLNKRLSILHELLEVLGNELNHQHSSRLELTIIWLIVFEVCISLLRDVFGVI